MDVKVHADMDGQEREELPEEADTVIWAGPPDSGFHLNNPEKYKQYLPDDLDLDRTNKRGQGPTVVYEPGDEIPLPVAKKHWYGQTSMIAFDEDGNRVDDRTRGVYGEAIRRWEERQ